MTRETNMNDPNVPPVPQTSLPPLTSLIKPEQVAKLINLDERGKAQCYHGVSKLWEQITSKPPDSPEYQIAHRKLAEVTSNIRLSIKKFQNDNVAAAQAAQAAQTAQTAQGTQEVHATEAAQATQEGQQNGPAPPNHGQQSSLQQASTGAAQNQSSEHFSAKVLQLVQNQSFLVPPYISQQGQEQSHIWSRDARLKFAHHLQKHENAKAGIFELSKTGATRQKEGRPFSPEELVQLNNRKNRYQQAVREAEDYVAKFRTQQANLKAGAAGNPNRDLNQDPGMQLQNIEPPQVTAASQALQQRSDHQGQPHTVSSALDAARNQSNPGSRAAGSPQNVGQNPGQPLGHSNFNLGKNPSGQANLVQQNNQHVNQVATAGTGPAPPHNVPQQNPNPQPTASQGPQPLTYRAALAQTAHNYAQPNYPQSASQSSTHAHPQIGSREHIGNRDSQNPSNLKFPIPKELKVTPPAPIPMGPARPTLTGGPDNGATSSLSQPAIQKHPGYVLEGEGERVLSKKKLQELVRQVTGGGVEGEEGETMSAEVEEVSLTELLASGDYPYAHMTPDSSPGCRRFCRSSRRQCKSSRQAPSVDLPRGARYPTYP